MSNTWIPNEPGVRLFKKSKLAITTKPVKGIQLGAPGTQSGTSPSKIKKLKRPVGRGPRVWTQENSMARPIALIPAAVTFAKTQAAKFLAKRAASRLGPKWIKGDKAQSLKQYGAVVNKLGKEPFKAKNVNQKKLKSDSGKFKRATKDNLYETSLVRGRLRGITGKTVTKKITHAEQAAVKKELDAANRVVVGTGTLLAGGVYSNQHNVKKRKENRKRGNQIAHKKYLRD